MELIRQKIVALRPNLPRGYARIISERYPNISESSVHNAMNGRKASETVHDAIIELAKENKLAARLKELDSVLEDI